MNIKEVSFDQGDKDLFIIDDLRLKAEAIRYSIIPKLELLVNHSVSQVANVFGHNPLHFSSIVKSPNFRTRRTTEFKMNYDWAIVGISGQRKAELWKGVSRHDRKDITVLPFKMQFELTNDGLAFALFCSSDRFRLKTYKPFVDFHLKYQEQINVLCNEAFTHFSRKYFFEDLTPFTDLSKYLNILEKSNLFEVAILSQPIRYPITEMDIEQMVLSFTTLYPIYDSYVQIALGKEIQFEEHLKKLEKWLFSYYQTTKEVKAANTGIVDVEKAKALAERKVKVMPALRWQVFQRDGWRCVACGRTPEDNIILHIDHIIPRSKGGKDTFENYQTLCSTCNIGKSNRDQTDLRSRN